MRGREGEAERRNRGVREKGTEREAEKWARGRRRVGRGRTRHNVSNCLNPDDEYTAILVLFFHFSVGGTFFQIGSWKEKFS